MSSGDFRDEIRELAEGARGELEEHRQRARKAVAQKNKRISAILWVGGVLIFAEVLLLVVQLAVVSNRQPEGTGASEPHPLLAAQTCNGARYRAFQAMGDYRKKTGQWPLVLGDLVPDYVSQLPVDPETGLPLVYQRRGEGFELTCPGTG